MLNEMFKICHNMKTQKNYSIFRFLFCATVGHKDKVHTTK